MSFILEALKKAEREREARATPKRHTLSPHGPPPPRRVWPWAAALLLNAAVLAAGLLLLRPDSSKSPPQLQAVAPGGASAPAAEAREFPPEGAEASRDRRPQAPERRVASPVRIETPAPRTEPQPEVAAKPRPQRGQPPELAAEPAGDAALASGKRSSFPGPKAPRTAARTDPERRRTETAVPALPRFEQMSSEVRAAVPDLKVNLIAYAADPGERLVYIKNRRYFEGETVEGAFKIEAIRREGVVLSRQGERFLLVP